MIVTIIAVTAVIIAAVCLLTNAVKKEKEYAPIPEGEYVTDKLLYLSPYSSLFMGDSNGMRYSIKDGTLTMSGTITSDGEHTYKLSELMEIPFSDEEWDEAFWDTDTGEGVAWHGGRKRLSDYTEKYCFALESDYDGGYELYLFVMDDELWYVTYGWEIYRLKQMDTSPVDAARAYLKGKNITDEDISELTVSQDSFYNEAWKYTISPLSLKYGVNDGDNVIEVRAEYTIDGKEVSTLIITSSNETGFRVLDEVDYLPREFTAVISEVHGNEDVTGYEWQKYVIIPDEDSYGFTMGEATLVFSRPYYGNDFLNVGDKVMVKYSGEPVTSLTLVGFEQPAYYFLHMISLQEDIDVETQPDENNEPTAENAENTFQTVSRKQRPMIPDEHGGYNIDQNSELLDVRFAVPAEWTSNGYGIFMLGEEKVLEQNIIYSESYGLLTEGFTVDMVSGREIKTIDEKYGDENDPYRYYIHTSMQSYDGVYDHHHFVIQQNGYYGVFTFDGKKYFNMEMAESVLESVSISYVGSPVIPEYDTYSDEAYPADFSLCASYLTEYINASFGMGDFNARKYTNNESFAEYVDSKYAYERYLRTDDYLTKLLIHDDDIESGIKSNGTKWLAFNYEVSFIYAMSSGESGYGRMAYFEYSEDKNDNINIISAVDFGPFDSRYIGVQETMEEPPYEVDFSTAIVDVS